MVWFVDAFGFPYIVKKSVEILNVPPRNPLSMMNSSGSHNEIIYLYSTAIFSFTGIGKVVCQKFNISVGMSEKMTNKFDIERDTIPAL
jgi:hypothetical protein